MTEPDPFANLERKSNLEFMKDDQPHVVVIIGEGAFTPAIDNRFANVVGPFENKRLASNYAVRSRKRAHADLRADRHYRMSWHVRPLHPIDSGEED